MLMISLGLLYISQSEIVGQIPNSSNFLFQVSTKSGELLELFLDFQMGGL